MGRSKYFFDAPIQNYKVAFINTCTDFNADHWIRKRFLWNNLTFIFVNYILVDLKPYNKVLFDRF